jgi:transcriptional regulator with XRE-family HTH domain
MFVMCEQCGMSGTPRTTELAAAAGISKSYASEILSGSRTPSRSLAIHVLRRTGWRHAMLSGLTDEQIAVLEAIDPWGRTA